MYAVEFETTIDDGIVHVPEKYKELQKSKKAKVIILVEELTEQLAKQPKRYPHADIAGKIKIVGNIFSSAPESDWNLPK